MPHKLPDKLVVTFLKFLKVAFDHHISFVEQRQAARDGLRTVQIVRHHDGRHVMFLLQLENQLINFPGTDGI